MSSINNWFKDQDGCNVGAARDDIRNNLRLRYRVRYATTKFHKYAVGGAGYRYTYTAATNCEHNAELQLSLPLLTCVLYIGAHSFVCGRCYTVHAWFRVALGALQLRLVAPLSAAVVSQQRNASSYLSY